MDTQTLLATLGGTLAGGRHAYRIADESIRSAAQATAETGRERRKRERAAERQARKRSRDAAARLGADYTPEQAEAIAALFAVWQDAPRRNAIRRIARAILASDGARARCQDCRVDADACERHAVPRDWRSIVRAYRDAQTQARALASFGLSNDDMHADARSRFYRSVASHMHTYYGGSHHSPVYDAQDVLQDAFESALSDRQGMTFGTMYRHTRAAVTNAVWAYRLYGNHASQNAPEWTWADWEEWGASVTPKGIGEWVGYEAAREVRDALADQRAATDARRATQAAELDDAQRAIVALVDQGMTFARIASALGRTQQGILKDLGASDLPVSFVRTNVPDLDAPNVDSAQAEHADALRRKRAAVKRAVTGKRHATTTTVAMPTAISHTGLSDANPDMRAATVRRMLSVAHKLSHAGQFATARAVLVDARNV